MDFELLRKMFEVLGPSAILAGGAPRDWMLGKQIKDYDFYVKLSDLRKHTRSSGADELLRSFRLMYNPIYSTSPYGTIPLPICVFNSPDNNIQVMVLDDVNVPPSVLVFPTGRAITKIEDLVDLFDFGICKVWIASDGTLKLSPEFKEDSQNKELRLRVLPEMAYANIGRALAEHYPRLQQKYKDYQLVVVEPLLLTQAPIREAARHSGLTGIGVTFTDTLLDITKPKMPWKATTGGSGAIHMPKAIGSTAYVADYSS